MGFKVKFTEQSTSFKPAFGEVHNVSDGGYERGYAEGYDKGKEDAAPTIEALTVTENGTYTPPDGVDGYSPVTVDVYGAEDLDAVLSEQETLINNLKEALEGKTSGGSVGELSKYAKIVATPESTTSFTFKNPLGVIAKKVFVQRTVETATSNRKCQKYIADSDLGIGVAEFIDTSGDARYPVTFTSGKVGNSQFEITEEVITLYRYNSANTWDEGNEYEVEIYG